MSSKVHFPPLFQNAVGSEQNYFLRLARKHEKELALHENPGGLWEKDQFGKDWSNVTEHCLMVAARVDVFAGLLNLPNDVHEELILAASVHDFNKKEEIRLTVEDINRGGSGRKGVLAAEEKSKSILNNAGFPNRIISLVRYVSGDPDAIHYLEKFLSSPQPSPEHIAHLVIHYVDNYTRGSAWVEPVEQRGVSYINDIDRRNEMNSTNPAYRKMDEEGMLLNQNHSFFKGMTRYEAAAAFNHRVEKYFSVIISGNGTHVDNPLRIPELVDSFLKNKIKKAA